MASIAVAVSPLLHHHREIQERMASVTIALTGALPSPLSPPSIAVAKPSPSLSLLHHRCQI
ncbi:hypothetical protein E2562_031443 [Oryza meyeriana var. granulata]|uniref:Uncharacterized protein n=1 Tax=Oryza meyeriana var. granulata TaxID=110450 RepID=A0A6G1C162_9ORYZ|nr:hypothetical protein E2562_031443 [Oryza meyeriana var. granulata]